MAKNKATRKKKYLVFIDTNVFLDFYKVHEKARLSMFQHLSRIRNDIITTEQVAMEYSKNRQKVLFDSQQRLKSPDKPPVPAFLLEAKGTKGFQAAHKGMVEGARRVKKRLKEVLQHPTAKDPVYQAAQEIFHADIPYNLRRPDPLRFTIRRRARKRFLLGYPPRKDKDNSIGDAINWEWIVHCAKESGRHIIIVSRDSDYGISFDGSSYINDWLLEELRERTGSPKRQVHLMQSLAETLRLLGVSVTPAEEREEERTVLRPSFFYKQPLTVRLTEKDLDNLRELRYFLGVDAVREEDAEQEDETT